MKKIKVKIDTTPLLNEHAHRGIGSYTRFLSNELAKLDYVELLGNQSKIEDADVVHYPYFDLFFDTLPFVKKKPVVVTVHDVIPLKYPKYYEPGIKGTLRFMKQKKSLQKVNAIITDSKTTIADIQKYLKIDLDKIHPIYAGVNPHINDKQLSEKDLNRARRVYKLPSQYVLYVGDINYNKNVPQLIKAVKYLPSNIKLVCVGRNFQAQEIPEWQWIETQLAMSDVQKRVKFISNLKTNANQDLSAIYHLSLAYIQPSIDEGFGLPVVEAMRCHTPVIASKIDVLKEVGGSAAKYVESDAESMANGLIEIINMKENEKNELVNQAFKWSQKYSWSKTAKETVEVYQDAINGQSK